MRAITLHQPWASLAAIGAKRFETRSFPPPAKLIGQRIAIGAAARKIGRNDWGKRFPAAAWAPSIDALQPVYDDFNWNDLPRGAIVATAVLAGAYQVMCIRDGDVRWLELRIAKGVCENSLPPPDGGAIPGDLFGDYSEGRWAWLLTDVRRLAEPAPAKGKQGWWEWAPNEGQEAAAE
jgi:hypothetical protein